MPRVHNGCAIWQTNFEDLWEELNAEMYEWYTQTIDMEENRWIVNAEGATYPSDVVAMFKTG